MPAVANATDLPPRLGKYELVMPLAAGGMARIYIGRATGIGSFERHVVLKVITPERANDEIAVGMFLDEARLSASLNHQNVAQVFEVGQESGIHYLAMEYVHGQDLRALLAKAGAQAVRIPLELGLTAVAGAAAGLHHAHERRGPDGLPLGIVHRDVSPSNIMIGYDGAVKVLDFGIAKATSRSVETQSGIIKGKFAYMAPEQCRGRPVDRRSDVFSLGIILYEITTQHRCFRADSDFDTMHRIVIGDVVPPSRIAPSYPPALEAVVMKALAVESSKRYQSAGELLEAIEGFASAQRIPLSTMGLGRFMRDMFGEVAEPWVGRGSHPDIPVPKEATISSTNGPSPKLPDDEMTDRGTRVREPELEAPTRITPPVAPELAPTMPVPELGGAPMGVAQMPAPQMGAPQMPSTRHGYGSGGGMTAPGGPVTPGAPQSASSVSYPRYELPTRDPAPRANRTILYAGIALVAVGVFVVIALLVGGEGRDSTAGIAPHQAPAAVVAAPQPATTPPPPATTPPSPPAITPPPAVAPDAAVPVAPAPPPAAPAPTANKPAHAPRPHLGAHGEPHEAHESHAAKPHVTPAAKPKCQPPEAVNPFDTSCDGKPCPICP